MERQDDVLAANDKDLALASSLPAALRARLQLTPDKLQGLAEGLRQLAAGVAEGDLVGQLLQRVQVGEGLELAQQRVPIGVLLVIFESRPDCLPQVRILFTTVAHASQDPSISIKLQTFCYQSVVSYCRSNG